MSLSPESDSVREGEQPGLRSATTRIDDRISSALGSPGALLGQQGRTARRVVRGRGSRAGAVQPRSGRVGGVGVSGVVPGDSAARPSAQVPAGQDLTEMASSVLDTLGLLEGDEAE